MKIGTPPISTTPKKNKRVSEPPEFGNLVKNRVKYEESGFFGNFGKHGRKRGRDLNFSMYLENDEM